MSAEESPGVGLFVHALRSEWGLAVLSHELDGKRHYVFQDGQKRTLAGGFDSLMKRVDAPTLEQHVAYAKLRKLVEPRRQDGSTQWVGFDAQLERLRHAYPDGLSGERWESVVRGSNAEQALGRDALLERARTELARERLDGLLSARRFEEVWTNFVSLAEESKLVPAAQLRRQVPSARVHDVAVALCGILADGVANAERVDRFAQALTVATGKTPSWELATAPAALLYPREHVCVTLAAFRWQLKATGSRRVIPSVPSGAGYTVALALMRLLVHKLTEHGETPRDLLDVRDFMAQTVLPPRVRKRNVAPAQPQKGSHDADGH